VFDLRAGERTRIQNVFTSTDAGLRRLQSVVRPELQRRFGTVDPAVTEPTVANYGRFVVNPGGLVMIVVDLPFVIGPQSVPVPWSPLTDVVRPNLLPVLRS
jgi:hypothetical protein